MRRRPWPAFVGLILGCAPPTPDRPAGAVPEPVDSASSAPLGETGDSATTETTPPGPVVAAELQVAPWSCAEPERREAAPYDLWLGRAEPPKRAWFVGGGVVVFDAQGDGHLDVLFTGQYRQDLWLGDGRGGLVLAEGVFPFPLVMVTGGSAADFDGDGDADLVLTRFNLPTVLLENVGDRFVDATERLGLNGARTRAMVSAWGDFDRDGWLDLFLGSYGYIDEGPGDHEDFQPADRSFLLRSLGGAAFEEVALPKEVHDGYTLAGGWHDFNGDGWLDLYVVNDFGSAYPSRLLWNREGTLELDNFRSGLDMAVTGMGLGVADLNDDGALDVLVPQWDGLNLYLSGLHEVWFNWADSLGMVNDLGRDQKIAWGTELVDLDHDGQRDAPVAFGHLESTYDSAPVQPDALYLRQPDGQFRDLAPAWGLDDGGIGRGLIAADLNEDGWLDLVKADLGGPGRVHLSRCGTAASVRVQLEQPGPNRWAIGARVVAVAGARRFGGEVHAGGTSFASGGPPEVHLGLGDLDRLDALQVTWPDGARSELLDLPTRARLVVRRAGP